MSSFGGKILNSILMSNPITSGITEAVKLSHDSKLKDDPSFKSESLFEKIGDVAGKIGKAELAPFTPEGQEKAWKPVVMTGVNAAKDLHKQFDRAGKALNDGANALGEAELNGVTAPAVAAGDAVNAAVTPVASSASTTVNNTSADLSTLMSVINSSNA